MGIYLLKFSACLLILLAFYKLFLEILHIHKFKRAYLLGVLALSALIPFITFKEYVTIAATEVLTIQPSIVYETSLLSLEPKIDYTSNILWAIYGIGVLLFTIKFIFNLLKIKTRIKHNPKQHVGTFKHVLLNEKITPHTFFNYLFFNRKKYKTDLIPQEVFWHEETHAKQKHSIDVLLIEVLQIVLWFNPLIYIAKHAIKLNHEFLADQGVLQKGVYSSNYQKILLEFLNPDGKNNHNSTLVNAINYSSFKKRFTIMKTKKSKKTTLIRSLLLLPILTMVIYGFSEKETIEIQKSVQEVSETVSEENFPQAKIAVYNPERKSPSAQIINILINDRQDIYVEDELVLLNNISTKLTQILKRYRSENYLETEVHVLAEGQLDMKLLSSIKEQTNIAGTILTNVTARVIKMHEEQEKIFKGIQFSAHDTLYVMLKDGTVIKGTSTPKVKDDIPQPPAIAEFYPKPKYSKKLQALQDTYLEKNILYRSAVYVFKSSQIGNKGNLKSMYNDLIIHYNEYKTLAVKEKVFIQPSPSFVPFKKEIKTINLPPAPKRIDYIIDMAKKGAVFYLEDEKISSDRAIDLVKKNKKLNIVGPRKSDENQSIVTISTKPISVKKQKNETREQVVEYNKLAKNYNDMSSNSMRIHLKDVERLEYIYSLMSSKQKQNAESFPDFPKPPPPPKMIDITDSILPPPPSAPKVQDNIPLPPGIAEFYPKPKYSKDLQTLQDTYLEKSNLYRSTVVAFKSNQIGNEGNLKSMYNDLIINYNEYKALAIKEEVFIQPIPALVPFKKKISTPPVVPMVSKGELSNIPPPPPPPSPLDHVIEMAKKNATFYYKGKVITSDKAIGLIKKNNNMNIDTRGSSSNAPVVKLSIHPIEIDN